MDTIWVTQSAVFCCGCKSWLITFQKTDNSTSFQSTSFGDRRVGLFRKRSGERSRGRDLSGKAGHRWMLQLGLMMVVVGFLEQWEAAEGAGYLVEIEVAKRGGTVYTYTWFLILYFLLDFAHESFGQEAQSSCSINLWVTTPIPLRHGFALAWLLICHTCHTCRMVNVSSN